MVQLPDLKFRVIPISGSNVEKLFQFVFIGGGCTVECGPNLVGWVITAVRCDSCLAVVGSIPLRAPMGAQHDAVPDGKGVEKRRLAAAVRASQHDQARRCWDVLDCQVGKTPEILEGDGCEFHRFETFATAAGCAASVLCLAV